MLKLSQALLPTRKASFPSLDGVRGIAVLIVVINHALRSDGFSVGSEKFLEILPTGHFGVSIFFVLSGYLITKLLLAEEARNGRIDIRNFYVRRTFRILPLLYFYIVLVGFLDFVGVIPPQRGTSYFAAATFTNPLFFSVDWVFSHTWSLAVEEYFYLTFPVVFLLARWRTLICLFLLCLSPVIRVVDYLDPSFNIGYTVFTEGDAIMVGCLFSLLEERYGRFLAGFSQLRLAMSAVSCLLLCYGVERLQKEFLFGVVTVPFGVTVKAFLIGCFLVSAIRLREGMVWFLLNNRLIVAIGVVSYSIYMVQQLLFYRSGGEVSVFQQWPFSVALLFPFALLMYHGIESPFIRIARKWTSSSRRD